MRVTTRKEVVRKGKAALAMRRSAGWTRSEWIAEVVGVLGEAFVTFARATIARRCERRRDARATEAEFARTRVIEVHVHPVKDDFDQGAAFEKVVAELRDRAVPRTASRSSARSERVCTVRRGLDGPDVDEFWSRMREARRVLTG